jgi:glycerate dehydrogenase
VNIVVLDGYTLNPGDNPWDDLARLGEVTVYDRTAKEEIEARAGDAEILLTNKTVLDGNSLSHLPRLRFVSVLATGYNVVDVNAARARGIPVSNVPEYGTDSVAQHVFALLLELCHHVGKHSEAVRNEEWVAAKDFCFWKSSVVELAGRTLGVVGFGRIGQRVGALANAFGMRVLAAGGRRRPVPAYEPFAWTEIGALFAASDVVSLHCPLTANNAAFVNTRLLARMKETAFLINTARGALVDEADLAAALNAGALAGAGLDVVSAEPMRSDNPLPGARNCIITPHIAWASVAARRRLMAATVRNVQAFLDGRPINVVNET